MTEVGRQPYPRKVGLDSVHERKGKPGNDFVTNLTLENLPSEQRDVVERALQRMEEERFRAYFKRPEERRAADQLLQQAVTEVSTVKGWRLDARVYDIALLYASLDHQGLDDALIALHHGAGLVAATIHEELQQTEQGADLADLNMHMARSSYRDARLEQKALYDKLTGLQNDPDSVRDRFVAERDRLLHEGDPDEVMVVVEVDLMHFKDLNTQFGNSVIDAQVLAPLGKELRQRFRSHDIRCRFGGDEFTIIFSRIQTEDVQKFLEHVQQVVEQCPYGTLIPAGSIKARVGAVVLRSEELTQIETRNAQQFINDLRWEPLLAAEEVKRRMNRGETTQIALWDTAMSQDRDITWEVMIDNIMRANARVIADMREQFGEVSANVFKINLRKAVEQAARADTE